MPSSFKLVVAHHSARRVAAFRSLVEVPHAL